MKRTIYLMISAALLMVAFNSCKDQKDIYQEWVKPGGYVYPEKATGLTTNPGHNRVLVKWAYPKDPSVTHGTLYWSTRMDSLTFNYADYIGQDTIRIYVDNLREQSYEFEVVNYDNDGNVSVTSATSVSPYADIWLGTHAERQMRSAEVSGDKAIVQTGFGTDEMVATQYRYVTTNGDTVVLPEVQDVNTQSIELPNAAAGTRYQFRSAYCPSNGIDTIWNEWRLGPTPIAGFLNPRSDWSVTTNVTNNNDPNLIFDGVKGSNNWNNGWRSTANTYPKIVQIDLQKEYMLNRIAVYQNVSGGYTLRTLNNVMMYVSDKPFNLEAGSTFSNFDSSDPTFANSLGKWGTVFWNGTASWSCSFGRYISTRYIALVIFNSRRNGSAIQEVELYGYEVLDNE